VTRTLPKALALAALLAVAAGCGLLSYRAFAVRSHGPDDWTRAVTVARHAESIKAVVPSLQVREQAVAMFEHLARSGPPALRSRARLTAGLLQVRNAGSQPDPTQALALAVEDLQIAVRLDRNNDDAAYDLELLLSRSAQAGHPIGEPRPEKKKKGRAGKPGQAPPGTGY
jgi:hypothetical protein